MTGENWWSIYLGRGTYIYFPLRFLCHVFFAIIVPHVRLVCVCVCSSYSTSNCCWNENWSSKRKPGAGEICGSFARNIYSFFTRSFVREREKKERSASEQFFPSPLSPAFFMKILVVALVVLSLVIVVSSVYFAPVNAIIMLCLTVFLQEKPE